MLLHVNGADSGRLRMRDLAESVLLSPSGVTRLVDRMEEAGLVARDTCSLDRRGSYAVLTVAGKAALRRAAPVHLRGIQQHFGGNVTDDEADAVAGALGRVVAALRG